VIVCPECKLFKGWGKLCCDGMDFPCKPNILETCLHYKEAGK